MSEPPRSGESLRLAINEDSLIRHEVIVTDTDLVTELFELIMTANRRLYLNPSVESALTVLTKTEVLVMGSIRSLDQPTPSEVAMDTGLSRSNLSTVLRSLERKGLVTRTRSADDRRVVYLAPTEMALRSFTEIHDVWRRVLRPALGDHPDLEAAVRVLRIFSDVLSPEALRHSMNEPDDKTTTPNDEPSDQ